MLPFSLSGFEIQEIHRVETTVVITARALRPTAICFLGVDDLAFRRSHTYGTILVNLETHRPVDILSDRTAETLSRWLKEYPGVELISRDRSSEYARLPRCLSKIALLLSQLDLFGISPCCCTLAATTLSETQDT